MFVQINVDLILDNITQAQAPDGTQRLLCMCRSHKSKVTTSFDVRFLHIQNENVTVRTTAQLASALCGSYNPVDNNDTAKILGVTDTVTRAINIIAEGVPESATQSTLLCGKGSNVQGDSVVFELRTPDTFVPLSLTRYLSWTADIMGSSLNNLDDLISRVQY